MMNQTANSINVKVDSSWTPVNTSDSKALADEIISEEFQDALSCMLDDFDKLVPTEDTDSGRSFISMAQKNRLIEKHFPFCQLLFRSQFLSIEEGRECCYMTLYVLTEEGYLPWFSRMGMGDHVNPSTDGVMADAETSAKRRLMIALGLGYEGGEESIELDANRTARAIDEHIVKYGTNLYNVVADYSARHRKFNLPKLDGNYPKSEKDSEKLNFSIADMGNDDMLLLLSFLKSKEEVEGENNTD